MKKKIFTMKFTAKLNMRNITINIQDFAPQNTTMATEQNMHRKEKTDICISFISMERQADKESEKERKRVSEFNAQNKSDRFF